ncbi:ABC transporter permease, partial [Bacteroidota bacterium]
ACSFLIYLYVLHETSYNKFHKEADNIYRINTYMSFGQGELMPSATSHVRIGEYMKNDYPEIKEFARFKDISHYYGGQFIFNDGIYIKEEKFSLVDENFFKIFSWELISGNINELLNNTYDLVITEAMAMKYFNTDNPIGESLLIKNLTGENYFTITGIIKNFPSNSTLSTNFIGNINMVTADYENRGWNGGGFETYFLLDEKSNPVELDEKMKVFSNKYHPDIKHEYHLQSMKDIYFGSSSLSWYDDPQGNKNNIILFSIIALLILLIAGINYIIIATARSSIRTIEIGIRKVVGAGRKDLFKQIMGESFLFSFIALPFAIMITELLLPIMNNLLGKAMEINYAENWKFIIGMILITSIIGLLSGSYLSFYLSGFKPENILRKRFTKTESKSVLRKTLIITQLVIFIVLFIFSEIIYKQLKYIQKDDPGFTTENLIAVIPPHAHNLVSCAPFIQEIQGHSSISNISEINCGLFTAASTFSNFRSSRDSEKEIRLQGLLADYNFVNTLGFKIIQGRDFLSGFSSDSSVVILNETAVKELGIKDPIGKIIISDTTEIKIIGVVKDFNIGSLHEKIPPLYIRIKESRSMICQIAIKTKTPISEDLIDFLKEKWELAGPNSFFEYSFFDQSFNNLYAADRKFGNTIKLFTILTIIIAASGLFGFSIFVSKQRTKEIGIRKVYGASVISIVKKITQEFIFLVFIANIISIPFAIFISNKWLSNFAYKDEINLMPFVIAFIITSLIVFLTLMYNTIKAAGSNPAKSLRYE